MKFDSHEWMMLAGQGCVIWISRRPTYCDRGNYLSMVEPYHRELDDRGPLIDEQDAWPRYYFDLGCALSELTAWLKKRRRFLTDDWRVATTNMLLDEALIKGTLWKSDSRSKSRQLMSSS